MEAKELNFKQKVFKKIIDEKIMQAEINFKDRDMILEIKKDNMEIFKSISEKYGVDVEVLANEMSCLIFKRGIVEITSIDLAPEKTTLTPEEKQLLLDRNEQLRQSKLI